ncbi:iron ABC transporter permease [Xinfangfangia sp. D13-10-4-6]|uniref:ABC transporter permease n=1 Tax=Pseudogemmobacter hezensis TaxID=2737662 RepID=UPI00155442A2|nr:iron ABC transporter permease [Pseudogemmobacter hezensis]NPD17043.1 iron ABC transporter permease [Pseudogemmobacter hezensis]
MTQSVTGPAERTMDKGAMIQWSITALTVVLVLGPLLPIFVQAFSAKPIYEADPGRTLDNFTTLLGSSSFHDTLWNTLVFGVITALVAQLSGVITAIMVSRTNLPGRRVIGEILIWPLLVSHLVIAFGWFTMYGPSGYVSLWMRANLGFVPWNLYTVEGMGVIAGLSQAPLAYLLCLSSLSKANAQLEDAARSVGAGPFTALMRVTLPMMRPAIIYSTVLNFVIGIEMLSIPLIFGVPARIETLTTFLYNQGINAPSGPDYGIVAAAAVILLFAVSGLVWLQGRLMKNRDRFVTVGGKASRPAVIDLGRWRWPAFVVIGGFVFTTIILVFLGVFMRAGVTILSPLVPIAKVATWDNFSVIFDHANYTRSIWNSLLVGIIGGVVGTAAVTLIALVAVRSSFRHGRKLEHVALFPRAVPGIIAGIGFFYAVIWVPGLDALRGTIWILILAFTVRYIPVGFSALAPALGQISRDLDRAGYTVGASWWQVSTRIVIPLLKPAMFSCFALLFIHFFKEYVSAVYLFQPGSEIIGTSMLSLWAQGNSGAVSALATIQIALTATFVIIARKLMGVRIYG